MFQKKLSLYSLFASMTLALLLTSGCGPKDLHVKNASNGSNKDTYDAEGSDVTRSQTELSLYERCLLRQKGRSEAAANAYCENMMTNMESPNSYTYRPIIGTAPLRY